MSQFIEGNHHEIPAPYTIMMAQQAVQNGQAALVGPSSETSFSTFCQTSFPEQIVIWWQFLTEIAKSQTSLDSFTDSRFLSLTTPA